jgi:hypothetical protein
LISQKVRACGNINDSVKNQSQNRKKCAISLCG